MPLLFSLLFLHLPLKINQLLKLYILQKHSPRKHELQGDEKYMSDLLDDFENLDDVGESWSSWETVNINNKQNDHSNNRQIEFKPGEPMRLPEHTNIRIVANPGQIPDDDMEPGHEDYDEHEKDGEDRHQTKSVTIKTVKTTTTSTSSKPSSDPCKHNWLDEKERNRIRDQIHKIFPSNFFSGSKRSPAAPQMKQAGVKKC